MAYYYSNAQMRSFSFDNYYSKLRPPPDGPAILVIHGTLDAVLPFSSLAHLLSVIPHARTVDVGPLPGQIDHLDFGHNWFEYFDVDRWRLVLEKFLEDEAVSSSSWKKSLL